MDSSSSAEKTTSEECPFDFTSRHGQIFRNTVNHVYQRAQWRALSHYSQYGKVYGVYIRTDESFEWICERNTTSLSTFSSIGTTWFREKTDWVPARHSPIRIGDCPFAAMMSRTEDALRNQIAESILYALGFHVDEIRGSVCICGMSNDFATPEPISRCIQDRLEKGILEGKKRTRKPWDERTMNIIKDLNLLNPNVISQDPHIAAIQQTISLSMGDDIQEYETMFAKVQSEPSFSIRHSIPRQPRPRIPRASGLSYLKIGIVEKKEMTSSQCGSIIRHELGKLALTHDG